MAENHKQYHGSTTATTVSTALRLGHPEIVAESPVSEETLMKNKKKRGRSAAQTDKSGPGLREISVKVRDKVESKGRTTYNEVAEELVAEYADTTNVLGTSDQDSDSKTNNIQRRVYDALNVLIAMDIIAKDKKEVLWKGLAQPSSNDVEKLKWERGQLIKRLEKKSSYLEELQEQIEGYRNLVQHNQQLYSNGSASNGGVALPFILIQTRPSATVEVEISEDMQVVHFDFDSTPFELHDDNYVLKQLKICEQHQIDG